MKNITILTLLFLCAFFSYAQEETVYRENIKAKAKAINETTIKLRWAPANVRAWLDGRKYGYILERYTLIVDSVYKNNPQKSISDLNIMAAPLVDWEKYANESDYAAVIAQSLYGDDFEMTTTKSSVGEIMNQANELEQRFALSLYAAENDYKAAELAGWAYTDSNTKKNEQYLYRIILNRPEKIAGDTAVAFIGFVDIKPLPMPFELDAMWGDKSVMLLWNYEMLSDIYHSYYIERKTGDDINFKRITNLPVTPVGDNVLTMIYTDSLASNDIKYTYRVQGVSTFDEIGPFSEEISGRGKVITKCIPNITQAHFNEQNKASLIWEFECENIHDIDKLQIKRANLPDGIFEIVVDNISPEGKKAVFDIPQDRSYMKLYAISKDSMETASYPFLLDRKDTIPPAIPTGLRVEIDSVAVAHLSWNANTELDLRGYRILRSFNENDEKSSILSNFLVDTVFTDTLSLRLGNEKVYYAISALDMHYNESQPCATVATEKPNLSAPTMPAIIGYSMSGDSVSVSWITNKARPEVKYFLHRIQRGVPDSLSIIFEADAQINHYTDIPEETGEYTYWIVATDTKGKKSESPQRLTLDVTVSGQLKPVSGFGSYVNREDRYVELFWKKNPEATLYQIYKQKADQNTIFWREVDVNTNRIVDEDVSPSTMYQYTIIYINGDGRMSPAKTVKVDY